MSLVCYRCGRPMDREKSVDDGHGLAHLECAQQRISKTKSKRKDKKIMAKGQVYYVFPKDFDLEEFTRSDIEEMAEKGLLDNSQVQHGKLRGPVPVTSETKTIVNIGPIPGLERKGKGEQD